MVPKIKEAVRKNLIIDLGKGYIHPAIVSQVLEDEGLVAEFRTGPEGTYIRRGRPGSNLADTLAEHHDVIIIDNLATE